VIREPLAVLRSDAMVMRNRVSDLERLGARPLMPALM
jgi:hypothetical protein